MLQVPILDKNEKVLCAHWHCVREHILGVKLIRLSLWVFVDMYKQQSVQDANGLEYLECTWDASLIHKDNTCHRRNGLSLRKMSGIGNGKLLGYNCLYLLLAIFSNSIMHVVTGKSTRLTCNSHVTFTGVCPCALEMCVYLPLGLESGLLY